MRNSEEMAETSFVPFVGLYDSWSKLQALAIVVYKFKWVGCSGRSGDFFKTSKFEVKKFEVLEGAECK